ncbi:Uncharacterized conserved protein YbjQ, UPF0145 family [Raineyella antarctica]|uniref:Uncharacterized conserved protein YbjQ, UPF0145 family n=1 Tax=Raineyella antarctica TaxID=1577474 RepID=A0A1G6GES8_9ACTN|nr:heavy metal-binding domain-containing protein [Raineyella antarctica]SDB80508.1 Uncharacterized conserved protein YbjQ, UPF0145 family [Raineyella antarctica]
MTHPPTAWTPPGSGASAEPPAPHPTAPPAPTVQHQPSTAQPSEHGTPYPVPPSQPARPGQPAQPQQPAVEAPAPTPPQRADHGMPVTTTDSFPGRTIAQVIGDVMGVVARSRELGGNHGIQTRTLLVERQEAVTRMCRMARDAGADSVVGMRFDTCQVNDELIEVIAYGTAVRFAESAGFTGSPVDLPRPSTTASATHPPVHHQQHTPPPTATS